MMTITEALAETKTIKARLAKKQEFIVANSLRHGLVVDALAKEGGAEKRLREESQAFDDLLRRLVKIRTEIQSANIRNSLTVEGETKTVAEWLNWRKECAPLERAFLDQIQRTIRDTKTKMIAQAPRDGDGKIDERVVPIVHVSEDALAKRAELVEKILGDLDGRLSLFNATTPIEV